MNFTYLSGVAYAGTLARHLDLAESPRPVFVVWPRSGDPVLIVNPLADAFLEVYASIEPGETERSVHSRMVASCMRRGATFAHGWMASSRNTVPAGGQSDVPFLEGDIVRTDYVAYLRGYPGHASRRICFSSPTAEPACSRTSSGPTNCMSSRRIEELGTA